MRFENKTVVVATSGGSIGTECARKLQEEGARVVLLTSDKADEKAAGSACKVVPVNCFYDEAEMEGKVKEAIGDAAADVVVTCLDAEPPKFAWNEIPEDDAHKYFDAVMTGVQTVLKYTLPAMVERRSGSVVIIESIVGRTGVKGENIMSAAAHAGLSGLIRNVATVFGKHNITVNGVAVGPIKGQKCEEAVAENVKPVLNIEGTGEDVANAVMYLADPAVFWNAGEIVDLNGGYFAV